MVCATLADLQRLVPEVSGEPWRVLVTTHLTQVQALGWSARLPERPTMPERPGLDWYTLDKLCDQRWVVLRLQAFEEDIGQPLDVAMEDVLGPISPARIETLAAVARAVLVARPPPWRPLGPGL